MNICLNEQIPKPAWQNLLNHSRFASPFQTYEFYSFINSVPGYKAIAVGIESLSVLFAVVVVAFEKEKGAKGYFSRRAIIYGGPVILEGYDDLLRVLIYETTKQINDSVIYIETRNFHDYSIYKDAFSRYGWNYQPYLNYHLNCSSRDIVWNNLDSNRKRQISKALKIGVSIKEASSLHEVRTFYYILKDLYDHKIKKPVPSLDFFELFFTSGLGKYLLVNYHKNIIGGIMCPVMPGKAIYEFYICGLDREYKDACPSVMATYAAIEYGFNNRLQYFDFMGAGKPGELYGVRDFKLKFGGKLVEHGRFIKINNKYLYMLGKSAISMLKSLKP